jgi:predicted solute-binding protein
MSVAPRIGCVPYLNARPLVFGIREPIDFQVPAKLADSFAAGAYDVALLPVYEILKSPHPLVVDGVSISARGPVRSVLVAHRLPLSKTPAIRLDPSSRSSSNLLRVLLDGFFRSPAELVASDDPGMARLIIGDPALELYRSKPDGWMITDLADAWTQWTGLPFVFAAWALQSAAPDAGALAQRLRQAASDGLRARPALAAECSDPEEALTYLTANIRYELGVAEKAGIERFRTELTAIGTLPESPAPVRWI